MAGSKKTVNVIHTVESTLTDAFAPVLQAIANMNAGHQDQGLAHATDGSLKFLVGTWLSSIYEQCYGDITIRDRRTNALTNIPNAKQRYETSQTLFEKLQAQHSGNDDALVSDPNYDRVVGWKHVNDARFDSYRGLIDSLSAVYKSVSGTDYVWVPRKATQMQDAVLTAEQKASRLKALQDMKARMAA
jgi:hypothetical protein